MKVTATEPGKVPAAVRKYLKDKGFTPSWNWDDVWQEEHAAAFTVAKAMGQDVLEALRQAVDTAIEGGQIFPEFKKRVRDVLAELGWWGVQDRENPKTGEVERVELGRLIYEIGPSEHHRPEHAAWAGSILAVDDPLWGTMFPPNG